MKQIEIPLQKILESATKFIKRGGKENKSPPKTFGMLTNINLARKAASDQQKKVD
jgi:hypothetical protein